jgi:hypothetical protein
MTNTIMNHIELRQRITELQSERSKQEELIRQNGSELIDILNPVNVIKKTINGLAHDAEVRQDALTTALNIGSDFIIGRLFRSNKSVKGQIFSEILGKLANRYISGNSSAIKDVIGRTINRFLDKKPQD